MSVGWFETNDVKKGIIKRKTKFIDDISSYELIYSGPHFYVSNPMYKTPRENCTEKSHYDVIDLEKKTDCFLPRTNYVPAIPIKKYLSNAKLYGFEKNDNYLDYYKAINSKMVNQAAERSLQSAICPPKISHIDGIYSIIFKDQKYLLNYIAYTSSIVIDFFVKLTGASNLTDSIMRYFPIEISDKYIYDTQVRVLRLNCVNVQYKSLWEQFYTDRFNNVKWSIDDKRLSNYNNLTNEYKIHNSLLNYYERRIALLELDVIISMLLGISFESLCLMYTSQFPVLVQNENDTWYDQKGNIVFTCSKGLTGVGVDRPVWNTISDMKEGETYEHTIEKSELYYGKKVTYYAPFEKCDRVEDYKVAWAHFEKIFNQN